MIIQIQCLSERSFSSLQVRPQCFILKQKPKKSFLLNNKKEFSSKKFCRLLLGNVKALKEKYTTLTFRTTDRPAY